MTDWNDEPRDRTFTPALEAQEARERAVRQNVGPTDASEARHREPTKHDGGGMKTIFTDPNWPPPDLGWRHPDANVEPTHRQSDGLMHTITPPTAEPLSPFQRAELERILLDMDCARERLRKLLERS